MRVTMRSLYAGPERTVAAGDTADFGVAEAAALVKGGYGVYADAPPRTAADADTDAEKPLERRTLEQLRAYAAAHDIDLGDATLKTDVLRLVLAEVEQRRDADDD
ncbi:hypothetical protein [Streptomyces sp. NPDC060198]|uniref:hypothetical protein n=1 Tax=Streptomyces sp. NPDC060198 TaxID=3347070 RepID=UPI00364B9DEE